MPAPWPWAPAAPPSSGVWSLSAPGSAAFGEVVVYDNAAATAVGTLRWKCDETALPLVETGGYSHQLTAAGLSGAGLAFGRPSLRVDTTGAAVTQATTTGVHLVGNWTPPLGRVGTDFTVAFLADLDGAPGTGSFLQVGLKGLGFVLLHKDPAAGGAPRPAEFYLNTGPGTWTLVYTAAVTGTFFALRMAAGGAFTAWVNTTVVSGTFTGWVPDPSWFVYTESNDAHGYKFQEINVWTGPASDTDIEAVRFALIGV